MSLPSKSAKVAPKAGQTPAALAPYPRPARESTPPPSFEFARQVANNASSGRMSVAAAFTNSVPLVNSAAIDDGKAVSDDLSPHSVELMRLPGAGIVGIL